MLYIILFTIGAILVTWLLYVALRPRTLEAQIPNADLRFIAISLVLIILTAATFASMLLLGKVDEAVIRF